ncbi:MAG TPA: hypothetical protein PKM43_11675 [Verrucomicrobiota bacterium]|nr:hypothetical protein [Verrucomicrobiota bacterium]
MAQGNGILVVDEVARGSVLLAYPAAAVWDMACRGRDRAHIAASLRWIMGNEHKVVGDVVRECLNSWILDGLLEPADPARRVT